MVINRRHIILASLVVALGLAIFLNYKFSDGTVATSAANSKGNLGDAAYVDNQNVSSAKSDIFATWRLTRSQTRDEIEQQMNSVTSNKAATSAEKQQAINEVIQLGKNIDAESQIETEIKAKGFAECVCLINSNGRASVIVKAKTASGLTSIDSAQIYDIVESDTKFAKDAITITQSD
jgi:hypothetical protein